MLQQVDYVEASSKMHYFFFYHEWTPLESLFFGNVY